MYILELLSFRIKRIFLLMFCAFCGLTLYLFHLQIGETNRFARLSKRNFIRKEKIESPRGNITDQYGTLLATNRPLYTLYWQGTGNLELTHEQLKNSALASSLCALDSSVLPKIPTAERRTQRIKLISDLPYAQLTKLVEQIPSRKNLVIKRTYERCYPYHDLACHIVGYLGIKDAIRGKMGLERIYNKKLEGQSGKVLTITNAIGHRLQAHTLSLASAGKTVKTTLDISLQKVAEQLFPKEFEGCFLLMDDDGALEVVLSRPSFEPGIFLRPITHTQWKLLQEKQGFINRAFSACYPPASLFKLITLAAALETGLITTATQWDCTGHVDFKGRRYHCNRRTGHGILSTKKAFAHSCNIPFYEIGKLISIDTLAHYAQDLGLGYKTGILFPEKQGLVPTTHWKRRVKKEPWWPGETLSAVIGQSSLLVTPLQMACMVSAVCTGYRIRPRILVDEPIIHEPLEVKQETLMFLQHCLHSVIKKGSATSLKTLEGFTIKGKSGTAQVRSLSTQRLEKKHLPHGYFAAHFQYKNEKPRTLVILLEHAGSSRHAIRLAYQFLSRYAKLVDPQPSPQKAIRSSDEDTLPHPRQKKESLPRTAHRRSARKVSRIYKRRKHHS